MNEEIKKELKRIDEYRKDDKSTIDFIIEGANIGKFLEAVNPDDMFIILKSKKSNHRAEISKHIYVIQELIELLKKYDWDYPKYKRGRQEGTSLDVLIYQYCARQLYLEYMENHKNMTGVNEFIQKEFEAAGHFKEIETIKSYTKNWDPSTG